MTTPTASSLASLAFLAGQEDGTAWAEERIRENALRAEQGDNPVSLAIPATGWDEACLNNAGHDVFARVTGLTPAQVEERGDAYLQACDEYNAGAAFGAKTAIGE